jgi:hypothetical protein
MIFILLAVICISTISWGWGFILFKLIQTVLKKTELLPTNFIITCFSGLALIGVVFSIVSFFLPMGGVTAQMLLILPVLVICTRFKNTTRIIWRDALQKTRELRPLLLVLLTACVTLVLLMGSFTITHPDTLVYHTQCIRWLQDYKTVPGLANLGYHYGLQSSWFVLSALFSFKFLTQIQAPFLNCTAVIWLIIFIVGKCSDSFEGRFNGKNSAGRGLLWLALLATSFWSYTQVRLTATSASPDFISAMYTWLVFYLVVDGASIKNEARVLLVIFLAMFAVSVKLSAMPVIFPALYFYYRYHTTPFRIAALRVVACAMLVAIPVIVRNFITTGYPLFPSPIGDFLQAEWKMPKAILLDRLDYITTYARLEDSRPINANADMNYSKWIPVWWNNQSLADQCLLCSLVILIVAALVLGAKRKVTTLNPYLWPSVFSFAGVVFWFTQAPDPRFGFGFITSSAGLLLLLLHSAFTKRLELPENALKGGLILFTLVIISYATYRTMKFSAWYNLLAPSGLVTLPFNTIRCQGININLPGADQGCGATMLPCVYRNCDEFRLRGRSLGDGFKPVNLMVR